MTAETLNALKGWPQQSAVDFTAKFDSTVLAALTRVEAGTVVYLSSTLTFLLGCDNTATNPMPMFTFQASDDPDVANDGGDPSTDIDPYVAISPTGNVMALVACGAYELVSTNYVDATYAPNDKLTAATGTGAAAGSLVAGVLGTNVICGTVSRGVVDNGYGVDALAFWPTFFPVYP
jgi:hypothetical protein